MPKFQEPAYQPGTLAHVESFDCGRRKKIKENKDFRESRWPDIPQFREIARKVWDEYTQIGMAVLRAISLNLHQDMNFLVRRCDSQDLSTMRLLHYCLCAFIERFCQGVLSLTCLLYTSDAAEEGIV